MLTVMDLRNSFASMALEEDEHNGVRQEDAGGRANRDHEPRYRGPTFDPPRALWSIGDENHPEWVDTERSALARRTNRDREVQNALTLGDPAQGAGVDGPATDVHDIMDEGNAESATEEDVAALEESSELSLANLREISSLASWTVSSFKPGCGVEALRSPSTALFWQSDGPQPHLLNIHFFKLVSIVKMRVYLDFELDESYTPTRMLFFAGMSNYDLTEFAEWVGEGPTGWVDVNLEGVGSRGCNVLRAMLVQIRICENHQNGKDTHVRGVQLFSKDERGSRKGKGGGESDVRNEGIEELVGWQEPDWMDEPVMR